MNGMRRPGSFLRLVAILVVGIVMTAPAQAEQRCVMVEYFTKFACDPCTVTAAILDSLTEEYPDSSLAIIRYRPLSWDPFYRPASAARKNYYNYFMSYPTAYFDGLVGIVGSADTSCQKYKQTIDDRLATPSPLDMTLDVDYDSLTGGGRLMAQVEAVDSVGGGDLRLRYAVIEFGLVYGGERYQEVPQDMFPNAEGVSFDIEEGEIFCDTVDFDLDDLWIPDDCSVIDTLKIACVAYVQDDASKEILESIQMPLILPPSDPLTVQDLTPMISGLRMFLTWSAVTMDTYCRPITVDDYQIYRCSDTVYYPCAAVLLDSTTQTFYTDTSCTCLKDPGKNCFYYLIARVEGAVSEPSSIVGEVDRDLFKHK
jgi:hypothetical protein